MTTAIFLSACTSAKTVTDTGKYYFDPAGGNDTNAGTSPGKAFKGLGKIRELHLLPGL